MAYSTNRTTAGSVMSKIQYLLPAFERLENQQSHAGKIGPYAESQLLGFPISEL